MSLSLLTVGKPQLWPWQCSPRGSSSPGEEDKRYKSAKEAASSEGNTAGEIGEEAEEERALWLSTVGT